MHAYYHLQLSVLHMHRIMFLIYTPAMMTIKVAIMIVGDVWLWYGTCILCFVGGAAMCMLCVWVHGI